MSMGGPGRPQWPPNSSAVSVGFIYLKKHFFTRVYNFIYVCINIIVAYELQLIIPWKLWRTSWIFWTTRPRYPDYAKPPRLAIP
jgi:hypothetical protein